MDFCMMKFLILGILLANFSVFSQCNLKIEYEVQLNVIKPSNNLNDSESEMHRYYLNLVEKSNKLFKGKYYVLKISNEESIFNAPDFMDYEKNKTLEIADQLLGFPKNVYTDIEEDVCIEEIDLLSKKVYYDSENEFDWQIHPETKKLLGYNVRKATTNIEMKFTESKFKNIEVWFTSDIPCSFGPANYYGLPGLILEVKSKSYTLSSVQINKNDSDIGIDPISEELVDKQYLLNMNKKIKNNY